MGWKEGVDHLETISADKESFSRLQISPGVILVELTPGHNTCNIAVYRLKSDTLSTCIVCITYTHHTQSHTSLFLTINIIVRPTYRKLYKLVIATNQVVLEPIKNACIHHTGKLQSVPEIS